MRPNTGARLNSFFFVTKNNMQVIILKMHPMKRGLTCSLLMLNLWLVAHTKQMNLQRALDLKLVKALVKSLGSYQGFCTQMDLENLVDDSLIVTVEAGRRLNSVNDDEQDILITKQEVICLGKKQKRSFSLKGYCCQAANRAPAMNSRYLVNVMADSNLVRIARYLSHSSYDPEVEQQAVWAISDNKPSRNVSSLKDTATPDIKSYVCFLKGEQVPWYSIITKTQRFAGGSIHTYPVWLKGDLLYDIDKDCYTTLHVLDEKGIEVCKIIEQWSYVARAQVFRLKLPVSMLARGKYTVELRSREKQLASREFEI